MLQASPARAGAFYSVSLVLLFTAGPAFQQLLGTAGVILNQILFFLVLAVGFSYTLDRRPLAEGLRLRSLTPAGAAKAVLLGAVAWALVQMLGLLITDLVQRAGGTLPQYYVPMPFVTALLARALLPAICEELAFRGYIQTNLAPLGSRAAIWLTALLFGAMHMSLIRLIPLALLGLLYAAAVERTGSVVTGVIMHLMNNVIVLTLTEFVPGAVSGAGGNPLLLAVGAAVLGGLAWGLVRSFGPGDRADSARVMAGGSGSARLMTGGVESAPATAGGPGAGAATLSLERRGLALLGLVGTVLPVLALYAWAVSRELALTFGG